MPAASDEPDLTAALLFRQALNEDVTNVVISLGRAASPADGNNDARECASAL
jgi:hypothetical protein